MKLKKGLIVILVIVLIVAILLYFQAWGGGLDTLKNLLSEGTVNDVVSFIRSWGIAAPLLSMILMVFQAVAAPIPSFLITAANGIVFGIVWGTVISWTGAMFGALLAFYLAKWLGQGFVQMKSKEPRWLQRVEELSGEHGFMIVLVARLLPVVSFDLVSFAAGLSQMKLRSFLTATGIGMIPGTVVYTVVGHDLAHLDEYSNRLLIFSSILVVIMIIGYILKQRVKKNEI
jgi:uncharacterized membrane protein YdjX (TVP38/TMEM64 family)